MTSLNSIKYRLKKILGFDIHYPVKKFKKKNIIFIHIPKNAGTSISKLIGLYSKKHFTVKQVKKKVGDDWNNSFKFAVVRNPYERVLSIYNEYIKVNKISQNEIENDFSFENWVINCFQNKEKKYIKWEPLFFTQKKWLENKFGQIEIDYIAKFENLQQEISHISSIAGINNKLPRLNTSNNKKKYSSFGTSKTDIIIEKYFKEDFQSFNYKMKYTSK